MPTFAGCRSVAWALTAAALLMWADASVSAQMTGSITGSVVGTERTPAPGVTVVLIDEATGAKSSPVLTNGQGIYILRVASPGLYAVEVFLRGFRTVVRRRVAVSRGDRISLPAIRLAPLGVPDLSAERKAAEELDLREATFRYQFERNHSGLKGRAGVYYLSVLGDDARPSDPSTQFIARFAGNGAPLVRAQSECDKSSRGVFDKRTGAPGLLFSSGAIRWFSDTEAEVSAGYFESGVSWAETTYFVEKVGGRWVVINIVHQEMG